MGKQANQFLYILSLGLLILSAVTVNWIIPDVQEGGVIGFGLCFPSPSVWAISDELSRGLQCGMLIAASVGYILLDKRYNLVSHPKLWTATVFCLLCAVYPAAMRLTGGSFMVLVSLVSLSELFAAYRKDRMRSDRIFVVASLLGVCSLFQYGFMLAAPLWLLICLSLGVMRLKGFLAFLLGLTAPWICVFGTGLAHLSDLQLPELHPVFIEAVAPADRLWLMLVPGLAIFALFVLSLHNLMRLYSAKKEKRAFNRAVNLMGIGMALLCVADYTNFLCYVPTLYMATAIQAGHTMARKNQ